MHFSRAIQALSLIISQGSVTVAFCLGAAGFPGAARAAGAAFPCLARPGRQGGRALLPRPAEGTRIA
jgi:hypothetical protein